MPPDVMDHDDETFVQIGASQLDASSDPRAFKSLNHGGGAAGGGATHKASSRVFFLRTVDSRKWHYSEALGLCLDFFVQILAVAFTPKQGTVVSDAFSDQVTAQASRYFSSGFLVCYVFDMVMRVCGLRSALLRSPSNIADLVCVLALGALLGGRYYFAKYEFDLALGYICVIALRLVLKPRARTFSKKLHKFRANGDTIRISIESLRASLARIPGISALAIEKMETHLVILCGRDAGDMNRTELMQFLELALRYRPPTLSATEFLAHLRGIDASSSQIAYSVFDVVRSTFSHWSNQMGALTLCVLVACVNAAVSPLMAYILSRIADVLYLLRSSQDPLEDSRIYYEIILLVGLIVPFVLGDFAIGFFQSKMIAKATERMQIKLLATILHQNTGFFASRSEGDLNNLFSSDVARVNALWQAVFWNLLNPLIAVVFGFGYAFYMKYPIGVMSFAFAGVILSSGPQGYAGQRSKLFVSKNAYIAAEFQNAVGCEKVVRAYAIQEPLLVRFKKLGVTLRNAQFSKDFWSSLVQIYIESSMYIFTAIMTAALALKVYNQLKFPNDAIKNGEFFAFMTLLQRVSNPVTTLGGFMRVAIGNASSLQRLDDVILGLSVSSAENDADKDLPSLPKMQKELRIEKLVFKYEKDTEKYVLNELSATVARGSYTCIVGPSGCGKSTLLACLMQFQEPDGGCIRLDGHDIFNFSKASFMNQTAVVFQDGGILNGSIYDNIRYGYLDASDQDCEQAARLAECAFIGELKDGFHTIVGQHATASLSGGQMQRLCLARALCRKPSVLLLDEATSALDPETEASIIATLERLTKSMDMTILSVTHRLSTTLHADQILVLNMGRVAEEGKYEELLKKGGLFTEMIHKTDDSDDDNNAESALPMPTKSRHASVEMGTGMNMGEDASGGLGDSRLALQHFTNKLSTRAVARRNSNNRRSGNRSLLDGGGHFVGRGAATSAAAAGNTTNAPGEDNKYFVL